MLVKYSYQLESYSYETCHDAKHPQQKKMVEMRPWGQVSLLHCTHAECSMTAFFRTFVGLHIVQHPEQSLLADLRLLVE